MFSTVFNAPPTLHRRPERAGRPYAKPTCRTSENFNSGTISATWDFSPAPHITACSRREAFVAHSGECCRSEERKNLGVCLKITRGAVFAQKAGWRGATKENIPGGSLTEEL